MMNYLLSILAEYIVNSAEHNAFDYNTCENSSFQSLMPPYGMTAYVRLYKTARKNFTNPNDDNNSNLGAARLNFETCLMNAALKENQWIGESD